MKLACTIILCLFFFNHSKAVDLALQMGNDSLKNRSVSIPIINQKFTVDGKLDEPFWRDAAKIELLYEVEPAENVPAPVKTYVYLCHSESHLFIAFQAFDPEPEKIRAHFSDRDNVFNDDWIGVVLDTYNDERRSFDFICNPYGIQLDMIESYNNSDIGWDAIWASDGKITSEGFIVEMSIPFSSLRFQNKNGQQVWGFDAVRSYPRNVRHHIGTFKRSRGNNCYLCQAIKIVGFEEAKPGKNIELSPTLSLNLNQSRTDGTTGDFQWNSKKLEPGFTGKWGITPNMTLGMTLNPDFSQVEADAAILDINQPFALFFAEKRPFFTEGSDFFNTKIDAIYTRTIRNPVWGIKLTGKENSHTIGASVVKDDITNLIFPGSQNSQDSSMNQSSYSSVLRYKKDIGNKYTLGLLLTDRQGENYFNRVYGFDGDVRITNKDLLSFMFGASSTKYPEKVVKRFDQPDGKFSDKVVDLSYSHNSRNIDYSVSYKYYGDRFRADEGFIPMVGYQQVAGNFQYGWINSKANDWWTDFLLSTTYSYTQNMQDNLLQEKMSSQLIYLGTLQMHSSIVYTYQKDLYGGQYFKQNKILLHQCMNPTGYSELFFNLKFGDQIDYANVRLGQKFNVVTGFNLNIGKHLKMYYSYIYDQLDYKGNNVFIANISDATIEYQFTKQLFFRTIIQYRHYKYNTSMYQFPIDPVRKNLFTQALLSYKVNPQTVVFIGYSDNYENNSDLQLIQTNKSLFFKIGYAFSL